MNLSSEIYRFQQETGRYPEFHEIVKIRDKLKLKHSRLYPILFVKQFYFLLMIPIISIILLVGIYSEYTFDVIANLIVNLIFIGFIGIIIAGIILNFFSFFILLLSIIFWPITLYVIFFES